MDTDKQPEHIFETIFKTPNVVLLDFNSVQYMKQEPIEYHCEETNSIIDIYVNWNYLKTKINKIINFISNLK